jgi:SCY1-like protein 2
LGKLVESLDKWIIIDEVLPLLQSVPSREPTVLMAILGIVKVAMSSTKAGGLPKEVLATKVIPFLIPISIETSLNLNQVNFLFMIVFIFRLFIWYSLMRIWQQ